MKRLYIGGLSHTVSEKDLRDRFGKFGKVSDAEIITRKDEHGSPLKTFGYINISISDSDYKKCLTVLNKSRWKGGTIQIEPAKESFLHRLAEERQKADEKSQMPRTDPQVKIVESFKAAGVENFHMKAAVPGTEIPGHTNWVVSKFGRVLPVLHLKFFKYDPSKHCHNIKKLDAVEGITPVSKLTWELDGGYDEISKKRRGEFPPQKKCLKKTRTDLSVSTAPCGTTFLTASKKRTSAQSSGGDHSVRQVKQSPSVKTVCFLDSDADSEDEIRMLVAHERSQIQKAVSVEEEDDNLEVVGDDFVVKSNMFWSGENGMRAQLASKSSKSDEEYDSADTDEILTQNKMPGKAEKPDFEELGENSVDKTSKDLENLVKNAEELSDDEESDGVISEPQAGPGELPETSPPRAPSKKSGNNPEDILASLFEPDMENEEQTKTPLKPSLPAFFGTKDLFSSSPSGSCLKRPAEKTDHESREEPKRLKGDQLSVPKKSSLEDQLSEPSHLSASVDPQPKINSASLPLTSSSSECASSSDEMESSEDDRPETVKVNASTHSVPKNQALTTPSPQKDITEASNAHAKLPNEHTTPASAADSSNSSTSTEESEASDEEEKGNNIEALQKGLSVASSKQTTNNAASHPKPLEQTVSDTVKQQQDNQKRLAALEQRKKEAEQQKKLIQGALSRLDTPNANKGKHIVFDSDDEDETPAPQKKTLFEEATDSDEEDRSGAVERQCLKEKEHKTAGGSKLFDSSEDEDDEENRFQIKPQFEGKAGQKLMELQSRFGTDPRFQMDAKFLENYEEEEEEDAGSQVPAEQELIEEKKKNLAILQSVVNVSIEPSDTSTKAAKGKTFRDISALHYDPTSDAHSAFESKMEAPKNESKAARRKKREEAEKLPEVSKEIYYDVAADLKEVFGTSTHSQNKKEELSWDKEEDENEDEATGQDMHMWSLSSSVEAEKEASSGFKFSFFGDDTADTTSKTDEYKIETLKEPKVSWQVDPRFQDSSSDEDDVEEDEEHKDQSASTSVTTEEPAPTKKFFFFFEDDIRLKEGPRMFWRSQKLEDQREAWEKKRAQLREDYRKKHKDAKRRQKSMTKN
ncbi:hypothetical protein MHYP_G00271430 [Metynnis hypsauchen]